MTTNLTEAGFEESAALGASEAVAHSPWVVMKFGGTSVSTRENWETIAALTRARLDAGLKPVIVHSALGGVSNTLENILDDRIVDGFRLDDFNTGHIRISLYWVRRFPEHRA